MPAKSSTSRITPVYAVCGGEAYLKQKTLDQLLDQVLGNADRALALNEYDGNEAVELASVLDDLRTLPFLSDRRLVVVRNADKFITQYREQLETYVSDPSETGVLLLECKSLPLNQKLAKAINKLGGYIKHDIKPYEVSGWLVRHARSEHGLSLDQRTAELLCDFCGREPGQLNTELEKLKLYLGERRKVTTADVEALVGHYREEDIWGILSAIARGEEALALQLWEDVWNTDRAAMARSVGGLAFQVRRLLKCKQDYAAGVPLEKIAFELKIFRDHERVKKELDAFTNEQAHEMLNHLLQADVAAKTGRRSVQTSIESFIVTMCRRGKSSGRTGR